MQEATSVGRVASPVRELAVWLPLSAMSPWASSSHLTSHPPSVPTAPTIHSGCWCLEFSGVTGIVQGPLREIAEARLSSVRVSLFSWDVGKWPFCITDCSCHSSQTPDAHSVPCDVMHM